MDSETGILIGKIVFYLALAGLVFLLVVKKRKQMKVPEKKPEDERKPEAGNSTENN